MKRVRNILQSKHCIDIFSTQTIEDHINSPAAGEIHNLLSVIQTPGIKNICYALRFQERPFTAAGGDENLGANASRNLNRRLPHATSAGWISTLSCALNLASSNSP